MMRKILRPWLCCGVAAALFFGGNRVNAQATVYVAAADASTEAKARAKFVARGIADQETINAALRSLPEAGGRVELSEGVFSICKTPGKLGGVLIERSRVTLCGQGPATRLVLAADQNANVIRIIGSGVGHVVVRDLEVDANRRQNSAGRGDPNLSHDRFEFCGIKAYSRAPGGPGAEDTHDITVQHCTVRNAHRLGIMLEGPNMRVLDNFLGDCGSDVVEILTGPGIIRGNYVAITEQTHVAIGSDRADSILMESNVVHVKGMGRLDIAFRSWAKSQRHVIAGNILTVDQGGVCTAAMEIRGRGAVVTGNVIQGLADSPTQIRATSGFVTMVGNVLENTTIVVDDQTGLDEPIVVANNACANVRIDRRRGSLIENDKAAPSTSAASDPRKHGGN